MDGADNDGELVRAVPRYLLRGTLHGMSADVVEGATRVAGIGDACIR